jgi:Protein of unknown function (DUF2795)
VLTRWYRTGVIYSVDVGLFQDGKDELIRAARAAGAPGEVIRALRAIPPEEYVNREEVARSMPKDPAEELQSWTRTSRPEDARA